QRVSGFFFFQAEDGIRVFHVTGVQTCALPIWPALPRPRTKHPCRTGSPYSHWHPFSTLSRRVPACRKFRGRSYAAGRTVLSPARSEERRVGKEFRSGGRTRLERKNDQPMMIRL